MLDQLLCADEQHEGQLGLRSILSILLMPMLLYSAASLAVNVILRWMGTVRMLSMEMSPFVVLNQRTHFPVLSEKFFRSKERGLRFCSKRSFLLSNGQNESRCHDFVSRTFSSLPFNGHFSAVF